MIAPLGNTVAIVTGGGRGVGRLFALALAEAGAAVVVTGRTEATLAATAAEVEARGGRASSAVFDVSDPQEVAAGLEAIERAHGRIDVLVNNAGILGPIDNAWEADPVAWWETMQVHLGGTFHGCRGVLPGMIRRGSGRIVNIVSHAGAHRWPTCSAYSVSKAAVIKFTENLAFETRRHGLAVFAMHPGLMPIGLSEEAVSMKAAPGSAAERATDWVRGELTAGKGIPPERATDLLVALASGAGDALTGCYLTVADDLAALSARAGEIRRDELLTLRIAALGDAQRGGVDDHDRNNRGS